MKRMLDELPNDWNEQIQESYNGLFAQSGVPPDVVTLPWGWLHAITVRTSPLIKIDKIYGMALRFGLVDKPVCAINLTSQEHDITIQDIKSEKYESC